MRVEKVSIGIAKSAKLSRKLAVFTLVLSICTIVSHRFDFIDGQEFLWLLTLIVAFASLALLLGIYGLVAMWRHGLRGLGAANFGILLAVLLLSPFFAAGAWAVMKPPMSDISTDAAEPPSMAGLADISKDYPGLLSREYEQAPDVVEKAVQALFANRGWNLQRHETSYLADLETVTVKNLEAESAVLPPDMVEFEASTRSLILGVVSNVAVRIEKRDNISVVDMRVASMSGWHGFGRNADLIRKFLEDLDGLLNIPGSLYPLPMPVEKKLN